MRLFLLHYMAYIWRMLKPFLVIKTFEGDYLSQIFETSEQANAAVNPSVDFQGDYICVYNLATERYVHIENFPGGINNAINDIIQNRLIDYKKAQ
jgi:hypothetical protein